MALTASKGLVAAVAAALLSLNSNAAAQEMPQVITPPEVTPDPNGLNLLTGKVMTQRPTISIPAAPRLTFSRLSDYWIYTDGQSNIGTLKADYSVHLGGDKSETFECNPECEPGNSASQFPGPPGELVQEKTAIRYWLNRKSYEYIDNIKGIKYTKHLVSRVTYPDGEQLTFTYQIYSAQPNSAWRLTKVQSNIGYNLAFTYWDSLGSSGWLNVKIAGIYADADPVNPLARLDYTSDGKQITDASGRTWSCNVNCGSGSDISPWRASDAFTLPTEGSAALTYTPNATNTFLTQTITRDGVPWTYTYSGVAAQYVGTLTSYKFDSVQVSGPNGYSRTYVTPSDDKGPSNPQRYSVKYVGSSTDELNRQTSYTYVGFAKFSYHLTGITYPEGNSTQFTYDFANNIIQRTDIAKPGSGLANIVQNAAYGEQFEWRPDWYRDANGKQTDFQYNEYGQLTQQLDPADASGVRRETDNTYTVTNGISRRTLERVCGQTTTCAGNAESRTEYTYWNNTFLPLTVTRKDEATGATETTSYTYDPAGRVLSVQGPQNGVNGTKYFCYDVIGRKIWEIGAADASNLRLAKRFTYRTSDDKVSKVETGTVSSPVNCNTLTLTLLEQTDTTYDSRRYPIREATSAASTNYSVTDRSFLDRVLADCTTVRMNMAALPAPTSTSACTLGTQGSQGPDRITKNVYDNAGQLLKIQKAYGVTTANGFPQTLQQDYVTYAYTNNGKQQFVTDANGNKAQYTWDGFDRLSKWNFPSPTTPGTVSTTDYEQYTYDPAGNRLSLRRRDGRTLTFTYDNLNRMLSKLVPDGCPPIQPPGTGCPAAWATRDAYFGYDILGRQKTAKFDSTTGADGVTNSYDGFGDLASSTISMSGVTKTVSSLYDLDHNRTRITHPDAQAFTYTYDARDRLVGVYEGIGTATALNTFSYNPDDSLSQRGEGATSASRANYSYDAVGRLTNQTDTFATGAGNVGWTFTLNPASQIATETRTNDAYAFAVTAANKAYAINGLNQYTSVGGTGQTYDANGNLTGDGTWAYIYDGENRLVSATKTGIAAGVLYDPLGRLWQVGGSGIGDVQFLYDGDALVAEYAVSTGGMTNRYVHGSSSAADDPLVWYIGGGLGSRRWLHADHLGSTVSSADAANVLANIASYDEYGVPGAGNSGRFGYTGQLWLSEIGLNYYKARMYSPRAGRFLQTDPIGYRDQINLYAYVANDPVNVNDPSGLDTGSTASQGIQSMTDAFNALPQDEKEERARDFFTMASIVYTLPFGLGEARLAAWGGRLLGFSGRGFSSAFRAAAQGGRHANLLREFTRMSDRQVGSALRKFERTIAEHKEKMAHPERWMTRDDPTDPEAVARARKTWQRTVDRATEQADIARDELSRRGIIATDPEL